MKVGKRAFLSDDLPVDHSVSIGSTADDTAKSEVSTGTKVVAIGGLIAIAGYATMAYLDSRPDPRTVEYRRKFRERHDRLFGATK